jgi:hypothetical protein
MAKHGSRPVNSFLDKETLEARDLIIRDVGDVTRSDLGLCESLVLVDDGVNAPAGDMSKNSYGTASAMLSMVAMDKDRIILLVKNYFHNRSHELFRNWSFVA